MRAPRKSNLDESCFFPKSPANQLCFRTLVTLVTSSAADYVFCDCGRPLCEALSEAGRYRLRNLYVRLNWNNQQDPRSGVVVGSESTQHKEVLGDNYSAGETNDNK